MSANLITALGLMLVLEGLLPLITPKVWLETFKRMVAMNDGQLRFVGLISMLTGLLLITFGR